MPMQKARQFIYRNARPLDLARWRFAFEDGSQAEVLRVLAAYQNEDGGFAHALEADHWNPNSSPIQTWAATEILWEIGFDDPEHPMVQSILRYLGSGADFDGQIWHKTIPSNNEYPGASWWNYTPSKEIDYNPTAALAGFVLCFAPKNSGLYALACRIAQEACVHLKAHIGETPMHTLACYVRLADWLKAAKIDDVIDLPMLRALLSREIQRLITRDTSVWATDYICKPSMFIGGKESPFYAENREITEYECDFILQNQGADGTWPITWHWGNNPQEWAISRNWWKADIIIKNLRFLKSIRK